MKHVLFLCTHNSARSILAEGLLNQLGAGRFLAYSAGSAPSGAVNPLALETLRMFGCDTAGMHSKSWDTYADAHAPKMDFIFTVCDHAAGESCPLWPGHPVSAHWGFPDPSVVQGSDEDRRRAFQHTAERIAHRIRRLLDLPINELDPQALLRTLREMGTT